MTAETSSQAEGTSRDGSLLVYLVRWLTVRAGFLFQTHSSVRQASEDAPTSSELLQIASENDGTRSGREADDKKREKEENWARYTDDNPKGAGNTMNRG